MKLSVESRYALAALTYLARQPPGTIVEAGVIAERAGLPPAFLSKIFAKLARHGQVLSHRGRERGYELATTPEGTSVRRILEAIDGPDVLTRCVFWGEACSDADPCPLHHTWAGLKPRIERAMEQTTLADVVAQGAVRPPR